MPNNPSQGLNLGGQPSAYGDTFSALNMFHGADAWITQGSGGAEVRGAVTVDDKGWATELPVVDGVEQMIWANVFYTQVMPAGDYIVEWKGEGHLSSWAEMEPLGDHKFRIKFDGSSPGNENGITLWIDETDPNNTGDYIRDIKIYKEGYADLVAMDEHFDPVWFNAIDDFRVLRTHDWQGTNFSQTTDWVPSEETADQAFWVHQERGMPYELLVEAANQSRSDLWINIPHMATDQYMREAAQYVKDHLDAGLRVYVEYTNEYWTTIFDQYQYLIDQGTEQFGDVPFANAQAYAARASEMTQIFKEIFGADGDRLYPTVTLNHNAFNTDEALTMLTSPAYVAQGGISLLDAGIRHLATDGYLGWYSPDPNTEAMLDGWMAEADGGFGSARDFLINQLNSDMIPAWAVGRDLADQYGLSYGIYEGGALLINGDYENPGPRRFTLFNESVQLSDEMKAVYEAALEAWADVGSGPYAWYSDTGRWGEWGDYGLWNAPDYVPEPRTEAIIDANQNTTPWWDGDTRPGSTFENGKYEAGSDGANNMAGTKYDDRLYGLKGNDTLTGDRGDDVLVGGFGVDTLSGGAGLDVLVGGAGADVLDGGDGFDFASYQTSTSMVRVDLMTQANNAGHAKGDTLVNIEGLIGSQGNDTLAGNDASNRLAGLDGNDHLEGHGGRDFLQGGAGDDSLTGGAGSDVFYLGPGLDRITDWQQGDRLAVTSTGWDFADPASVTIRQTGQHTLVSLAVGEDVWQLRLLNTNASSISVADDFIFN